MAHIDDFRLAGRTADESTIPTLRKAQRELEETLLIFEGLAHMYEVNSNYRYIDQAPNKRGQGESHVSLADVHGHVALLMPEGKERDEEFGIAFQQLDEADAIYNALTGKRARRGLANSKKVRGNIMKTMEKHDETKLLWSEALALFRENGDTMAESDMQKLLADLALEMDKEAVFRRKVKEMMTADNREEEAIKEAFDKYDTDGSGHIDMKEYQNLASELGTFPALTEDELAEALLQLDNSEDGQVTFEEFWMWWITDVVLDAEDPLNRASKKKKRGKHAPASGGAGPSA